MSNWNNGYEGIALELQQDANRTAERVAVALEAIAASLALIGERLSTEGRTDLVDPHWGDFPKDAKPGDFWPTHD